MVSISVSKSRVPALFRTLKRHAHVIVGDAARPDAGIDPELGLVALDPLRLPVIEDLGKSIATA